MNWFFLEENPRQSREYKLVETELESDPEWRKNKSEEEDSNSLLEDSKFKIFRTESASDLKGETGLPMHIVISSTTPNLLKAKERSIFKEKGVITTIAAYSAVGFVYTGIFSIFKLKFKLKISFGRRYSTLVDARRERWRIRLQY